jgi:LCP family protein required for cell wall assembly
MIEEQLRESFARHEVDAPDVDALRQGIARLSGRRRRRRIAVRSGGVAAVVAVVLLAVPVIVRSLPNRLPHLGPGVTANLPVRPLNFLVLGLDPTDPTGSARSDSVTIVHISAEYKRVYLVDIERDTLVDIPGHGQNRIAAAYAFGGAQLSVQTVQSLTGVTFDGVAVVTLDALRDLTGAVGGVQVCLPESVKSFHTGRTFPAGCQNLDGAGVDDLVRQRFNVTMGAYGRDANIQRVMMGLVTRVHALNILTDAGRVTALLHVGGLQIDLGSIDGIALAAQLKNLDAHDVVGIVPPYVGTTYSAAAASTQLDPVVEPLLFGALRGDTLDQFVTAHPGWTVAT